MKIEEGKFYLNADNIVFGPMERRETKKFGQHWATRHIFGAWDDFGKSLVVPNSDLVAEHTSPAAPIKSDGGPSSYYDFAGSWVTLNDAMEWLATNRWGAYALHLKDAMKACWRFGGKEGTDHAYDAKKLVYSGLRLLVMISGRKAARDYLTTMLNDPQFSED